MPMEFEYKTLRISLGLGMELTIAQQDQILILHSLDEWQKYTSNNTKISHHK